VARGNVSRSKFYGKRDRGKLIDLFQELAVVKKRNCEDCEVEITQYIIFIVVGLGNLFAALLD